MDHDNRGAGTDWCRSNGDSNPASTPAVIMEIARRQLHLHPVSSIGYRWALIAVCTGAAFWSTWVSLIHEVAGGTVVGYVFVAPLFALVAAQGIQSRRSGELPIHDRQIDTIVGGLTILVAAAISGLLVPRYAEDYQLMHLDLLACVFFCAGAATLLFGLRPVTRFWPVWLLLIAMGPLQYRMGAVLLGGSQFAYGAVMVLFAAVAAAISVGRNRLRAGLGFGLTLVFGLALVDLIGSVFPTAPLLVLQLVPPFVAATVVGIGFYLYRRRGRSLRPLGRPVAPLTAKTSRWTAISLVAVSIALFWISVPDTRTTPFPEGPPATASAALIVPLGWHQTDIAEYAWPTRYFGSRASLVRQTLVADNGDPRWDKHSHPRMVSMDVLDTTIPARMQVYPQRSMYQLGSARISPPITVDLGHGVTGELRTFVDDALLLTWTNLTFAWMRGDVAQRISLISVDNHDPTATFPQPTPAMANNIAVVLAVFLRGRGVIDDTAPDYKDAELLTQLARAVLASQGA